MSVFDTRKEKDFATFIQLIAKLRPEEFLGLCKLLGVQMLDLEKKPEGEDDKYSVRPMDEVLEELMDKFLNLRKKRRGEINKMLKDCTRGRG